MRLFSSPSKLENRSGPELLDPKLLGSNLAGSLQWLAGASLAGASPAGASLAGALFLALGVLSFSATTAKAQQAGSGGGEKPALEQRVPAPGQGVKSLTHYLKNPEVPIPSSVKERVPRPVLRRIEQQRERLQAGEGGMETRQAPTPKSIGGFPEFTEDQSWALNENPNPSLNFDLTGTPQFAGDVNGDGINDYVYTDGSARDDRTSRLEDRSGKTALFFGGDPSKEPDQLLYTEQGFPLQPVGDLNGDGRDDAIAIRGDEVRTYTGDSTGYTESERRFSTGFGVGQSVGFTDLDGDGYEDVVVFDQFTNEGRFAVIYGAGDLSRIDVRRYEPFRDFPNPQADRFTYNAADLEGDGQGEIVRLAGIRPNIKVQTLEVDSTRSVTQTQSFVADELNPFFTANRANLSLIDITGNDTLEIAAKDEFSGAKTYVFERNTDSTYAEAPDSLEKDEAVPVGDLDGDGNHDFFTFDESTGTRYVSYGPDNLSDGLSFDTEIPYGEDVFGTADFLLQGGLGDVTGNGRPDVGLSLSDNPDETVGRRFFSVDSDRNPQTTADVSYPEGRFFDQILSAQEIGDFNGDGTKDFALVRFDLGQIEVFYGGSSISQAPDLTIESPIDESYLSITSGDFNGDDTSDIAAGSNAGSQIEIFLGGEGADGQVDHTISASDLEISGLYDVHVIGDVNDNGADDLIASNFSGPDSLAVFLGGSTLPSTPSATIQYDGFSSAGETLAAPGDVNGDGIDDFVVGRPDFQEGDSRPGRADVYFGGENPSFSSPDLALVPDTDTTSAGSVFGFSSGLAGGDFDGDGNGDIAVRPRSAPGGVRISIFEGGSGIDAAADQRLAVPPETGLGRDFDRDGTVDNVGGSLEAVSLPGQPDALVQASGPSGTNAVLYRPLVGDVGPAAVFRAPNQDADLGGFSDVFGGVAAGDFTGSGRSDVVFPQTRDNNDAELSSRVYQYEVQGIPVASATVDVEENGEKVFEGTGLTVDFNNISGEGDVNAKKYLNAPVNTSGLSAEDVAARYTVEGSSGLIVGAGTTVQFDVGELPVEDTSSVVIYRRPTVGEGVFSGLETTYDREAGELVATAEPSGEFALAAAPDSVTVWAGDTNNDGTVDQADVLPLGTYWGTDGPARQETGCAWEGRSAGPWAPEAATYADANGDGTVDQEDVLCLGLNWGETRSKASSTGPALATSEGETRKGETGGKIVLQREEASGDAFWVEIRAQEVESLAGVATELTYDPAALSVETVEAGTRMGEDPLLQFNADEEAGTLGLGVSRKGKTTSKAAGPVARVKVRPEGSPAGGSPVGESPVGESSSGESQPEVSARSAQASTTGGQSVSLATGGGLESLPEEVALRAPAPNPVRQTGTLEYALPESGQVRLSVYDVLGREVAVLVNREQQAGRKQVDINASQWSSGTYFYRLEAGGATKTERFTVVH